MAGLHWPAGQPSCATNGSGRQPGADNSANNFCLSTLVKLGLALKSRLPCYLQWGPENTSSISVSGSGVLPFCVRLMLLPLHASPAFRLRQLLRPFILVCLSLFSATALMLVLSPHVYTFSQWPWKAARTSTSGPELDYVVFSSNSNSIDARPHPHFKQILPEWCLDAHFAFGSSCSPNPTGKYVVNAKKFDLVWTWVNSSDPRLRSAMREAGLVEEPTANKLYRWVPPIVPVLCIKT